MSPAPPTTTEIPSPSLALASFLPLLFSETPTALPIELLSPTTHLSHTFLSTPTTSPSYLQLVPSGTLSALHARLVERGIPDLHLGNPIYTIEEGGIRGRVEVSSADDYEDPRETDALAVDLVWEAGGREDDEGEGPRWLFVTLSLVTKGVKPKGWHVTLDAARAGEHTQHNDVVSTDHPSHSIVQDNRVSSLEEESAPGSFGTAEGFWDGWSYSGSDEEEVEERAAFVRNVRREEDEEKSLASNGGYWDSYDNVETSVGEVHLDDNDDDKRPQDVHRRRRSSTIRASPLPSPAAVNSTSQSPFFQPTQPPATQLSPKLNGASSPSRPAPTSSPSPPPSHSNGTTKPASPVGFEPAPTKQTDNDDALQFALAGIWSLYSKGSTLEELERKMEKWDLITNMLSSSGMHPQDAARHVQYLNALLSDLSLLSQFIGTTVPCRSTFPTPVAYFPLLARTTPISWKEVFQATHDEFPVPLICSGPTGLEMLVELARRCLSWDPDDHYVHTGIVQTWLESLVRLAAKESLLRRDGTTMVDETILMLSPAGVKIAG